MKLPAKSLGMFTATVVMVCGMSVDSLAENAAFTIDSNSSSITLGGAIQNVALTAQSSGSNTTSYSGTILADVTSSSLTFLGGSNIDAALQPTNQSPAIGGGSGNAPADYGLFADITVAQGNVAARDMVFDLTSGALVLGSSNFDASLLNLEIISGSVDFRVTGLINESGSESVVGQSGANGAAGGSLVTLGGTQILTIPIDLVIVTDDATLTGVGQIVATRVIPEPTSLMLIGAAGVCVLMRRSGSRIA